MEEVCLLRRRRVHCGRLSPTALPLHLGQGHRLTSKDAHWAEGRDTLGRCGKLNEYSLILLKTISIFAIISVYYSVYYPLSVASCSPHHPVYIHWSCERLVPESSMSLSPFHTRLRVPNPPVSIPYHPRSSCGVLMPQISRN